MILKKGSSSNKMMPNISCSGTKRTCVWNKERKMAELKHTQILYFCSGNGHVSTETVSTYIFKLKCRLHMPVYLFADAKDDVFLTCHYYVSAIFLKKKTLCVDLYRETDTHYTVKFFLSFHATFWFSERGRGSPQLHRVQLYALWGRIFKKYKIVNAAGHFLSKLF